MTTTRLALIAAVLLGIASSASAQSPARPVVDSFPVSLSTPVRGGGDVLDPLTEFQQHLLAVATQAAQVQPVVVVASSRFGVNTMDASQYARAIAESARSQARVDESRQEAAAAVQRLNSGVSATNRAIASYERALIAQAMADSNR